MKEKQKKSQNREPDPHLDVPSEANRDKHINFREVEDGSDELIRFDNKDEAGKRRSQWQQGIEEGKAARSGDAQNE